MAEEIKQAEALTAEENRQLFGWGENIFGVAALNLSWRPKDLHFLMYSEGQPISHVGVLKHVVSVDGEPVTVGGLGGVVTVPGARKKGFARRLIRHATKFLSQEWEVDACLLFCVSELAAYYVALGWQEVESPVLIEQPSGKIVSPLRVMVLPVRKEGWSFGRTEVRSLPW
jgi:predicted N-acetyltransferase YhbS